MLNWEWISDPNTVAVFLYLLLNANWKKTKFRGQEIPRGGLVTGRKAIAENLGISEQSVRTALNHLKSTNEITTKSTNKFTIITIVNWAKYQDSENESTNKSTNKSTSNQPTTNQQLTTEEEYKNIRIKEYNKRETKFTPPTLEEVRDYCQERRNGIDPGSFIDFYQSKGWKVGNQSMKDWKACIRTWENKRKKENEKGYISGHYDFDKLEKEAREAAGR